MKKSIDILGSLFIALLIAACSVMPSEVKNEAITDIPFEELVRNARQYMGSTVILGGYVVEVHNEKDLTRVTAVQAPLDFQQEPKSKDRSQGRLIIGYNGFLDPEVYTKDRRITVAGKLLGSSATEQTQENFPYVRIEMTHIYLWEKEKPYPRDPYWDRWWHPYPYYPYPWGWRHPYIW